MKPATSAAEERREAENAPVGHTHGKGLEQMRDARTAVLMPSPEGDAIAPHPATSTVPDSSSSVGRRAEAANDSNTANLETLVRLRRDGLRHETEERWDLAIADYDKALSIDKNATFALIGKGRSEKVLKLQQQLDFYLTNPDRLQSPEPRTHAKSLMAAAEATPDASARLLASRDKLKTIVDRLSVPRPVILRSDAETEVTVFRVGEFGRFKEHRLTLEPGQYRVRGSRAGYRDVGRSFVVSADASETIVEIRCEERI